MDYLAAEQFDVVVADAIASASLPLIVDLRAVAFIDSAGLTRLIKAHRAVSERGDSLGIVASTGIVRRVLDIAGLSGVLRVYDDLDSAIAAAKRADHTQT